MRTSTSAGRGVFIGKVLSNEPICRDHYRLALGVNAMPPTKPGQFVQLQCRGLAAQVGARAVDWPPRRLPRLTQPELADKEPLLRRPLSIAGRRDNGGRSELQFIYRTIGTGTGWLAGVRRGQELSLLGPLGNAFDISADKPLAALIGGGVGIPPMIYLAQAMAKAGRQTTAFSGAKTRDLLPLRLAGGVEVSPAGVPALCAEEFSQYGVPSVIATDDGSAGVAATVSDAFRNWLDSRRPDADRLVVYSCGPEPMMRAVAEICLSHGCRCQLAMERHMACGMGTCQSCVVKTRSDDDRGWKFSLCCTDGPVFDAGRLLW